jgi:hypothetical protein
MTDKSIRTKEETKRVAELRKLAQDAYNLSQANAVFAAEHEDAQKVCPLQFPEIALGHRLTAYEYRRIARTHGRLGNYFERHATQIENDGFTATLPMPRTLKLGVKAQPFKGGVIQIEASQ